MSILVNFLFLNMGHFFAHLMMLIYPVVALVLADELGRNYGDLLMLSIYGLIAFGAGSLPAGWLGDRWSRSAMMAVFFIGIGAAGVLVGLAQSERQIAAALALTEMISWRAAYIVPGVCAIATGVAYAVLSRRPSGEVEILAAVAQKSGAAVIRLDRKDRFRLLAVIVITGAAGGVIFNVMTIGLPKIFDERLPTIASSITDVGVWVTAVLAIAGFSQIVIGELIDRYPFKIVFLGVLVIEAPLHYIAATAIDWTMLGTALPLMLLVFGSIPIYDAIVARYVADVWRARVYAAKYVLTLGVSALAVPLIALFQASSEGFTRLFETLAVLAIVVGLSAIMLPGRRRETVSA